jgi:hypothetical protein
MSILRVANVQFNASGTRRIDYDSVADDGIIKISAEAVRFPVGSNGTRPPSEPGLIRYNSDVGYMEFGGPTKWIQVASNSVYDVANLAFAAANVAYNASNVSSNNTNSFQGQIASSYASINSNWTVTNTVYGVGNAAYGFANSAYASINSNWTVTNTVYGVANTALQNTSGVSFNGNFYVPSGNVGIGITSTTFKLDVSGAVRIGNSVAQGNPNSTDITTNAHTILSGTGGNYLAIGQYGAGNNYAQWIQSTFANPSTATYNLILNPLGGNIGIGTSSPTGKLDVASRGITKGSMPAGCVLQVVQTVLSSTASYAPNGTEQQVTGLACSITPSSSTSKILIMLNINYSSGGTTYGGYFKRSGTVIGVGDAGASQQRVGLGMALVTDGNQVNSFFYQYLDSPATTSSVAYTFWLNNDNTGTCFINRSQNDGNNNTGKRCISTVTLMEIAV